MSNYFAIARAFLASVDPAAPAAALVLTVFLVIYSLRRFAPKVWLAIEAKLPFVDTLDYRPIATIVSKFMQALPGALLGAGVASLSSGASVKTALLGVLAGFGASLVHEVMAAYKGQVSTPKPPSVGLAGGALLALCLMASTMAGCAAFAAAVPIIAEIGTIIADAVNDLDYVEQIVATFPGLSGDQRSAIEVKLQAARLALQAAAAADSGASDLTAAQLDASLTAFRAAWADLAAALADAGITTGAKLGATASTVSIPSPLALRPVTK